MQSISLPDPLYLEARRAAAASGLTVEAYVQEAVQLHLEEDAPLRLTPEQIAIIAQAEADMDAGKGMSLEEVKKELAANRRSWQAARPH